MDRSIENLLLDAVLSVEKERERVVGMLINSAALLLLLPFSSSSSCFLACLFFFMPVFG